MDKEQGSVEELRSTIDSAVSIGTDKLGLTTRFLNFIRQRSVVLFALLVAAGLGSFFKFVAIPGAAGAIIESAAKNHRLDISVEDWSVSLLGGTVTARNVNWKGKGRFTNDELMRADSITANFRRSSLLSFSPDLVGSIESIVVNDPTIYIENKNSGSWNWESAMSARNLTRQIDSIQQRIDSRDTELSEFDIASVEVKDLKIVWIEHLQAKSGNGRIQRLTSELNIDDAELVLSDILGWFQEEEQPIRVDFDGRTADGLIKASGEINPFWPINQKADGMQQVGWMPAVQGLTVYLENVDTQAFGQMVPDSLFQPVSGKMTGEIVFGLDRKGVSNYEVEMEYDEVKWALNERSSLYTTAFKEEKDTTETISALNQYAKSGLIKTSSKGSVSNEDFRLIPSIQTAMNRQAMADSPPAIRARAAQDQIRFEDKQISPELVELQKISSTIATINSVARQADSVARTSNAAVRSLNQVKGALGRIFK